MVDAVKPQPELGAAIRRIRERARLTQEDLAHGADIHPTWVSQIERGKTNPSWSTVKSLAAALDVTLVELAAAVERVELE